MKNVRTRASITDFVELNAEALHRATGGTGALPEMAGRGPATQVENKNGEAFAWSIGEPSNAAIAAGGCMLPEASGHAEDASSAPEDADALPECGEAHVDDVGDHDDGSLPEVPDDMPDDMPDDLSADASDDVSDDVSDDMSCLPVGAPPPPAISCSRDEVDAAKETCDLDVDDDLELPGGHDWSMGSGEGHASCPLPGEHDLPVWRVDGPHDHDVVKEIVCRVVDLVQQSGLVCHA